MQAIDDVRDDPEIAAAAAQGPKEVGVVALRRIEDSSVRSDDLGLQHVVAA
jgi:hypothetical protein